MASRRCRGQSPYCTFTSSNLAAFPAGTRIVYLNPAGLGTPTDSPLFLDPPGPGDNEAFGTCFLGSNPMHCEFSGGTGKFTWFQASVIVTVDNEGLWHWAGTYSFTPR
jgi:hypothetical protein